jgi:hypothetical protein
MRRIAITVICVVALGAGTAAVGGADKTELLKDEQHFAQQLQKTYTGGSKAGSALNMEVVGRHDLGGRGFNGDVWQHENHAYVGHWGFADWAVGNSRFCPSAPNNGVAVIDVADPARPTRVATLQNAPGTSAEDVVVFTQQSGPMAGHDIAASGIQWCGGGRHDPDAVRGLQLWDVTDPAEPVALGFYDSGCCTRGVHEFEVEYRADLGRTFAYATVPAGSYPDSLTPSGLRDAAGKGDFRLIDITDPNDPVEVSTWKVQQAGGPFAAQGCDADGNYGHGAEPSADGTRVFLSYWDSGYVELDVTDPAQPVYVTRAAYPADADGDAHSSQYDDARQLLFSADEDFCKASGPGIEPGFGYLRVWDFSDPGNVTQIGSYRTPRSAGTDDQGAGDFVIHNNFLVGTTLYTSWYTDGVRVIDVSNPRAPTEVAYFVPPATANPVKPSQRGVLTNTAQVWGVVVDEDGLVYASDMNSGLWILQVTAP